MPSKYKKKVVNILLATYNGSTFLLDQLNSLYQQTYTSLKITVRDDGSSDGSADILAKQANLELLTVLSGESNLGPAKNFFTLLENADPSASYFAFCDQDDIWLKDKIQRAINELEKIDADIPVLYCGPVIYASAKCEPIFQSAIPKRVGLGNALTENVITGCTIVMNKNARGLIIRNIPKKCLMHDSWCYLVISCFGEIVFDTQPKVLYRQHSKNFFGASLSLWGIVKKRATRIYKLNQFGFHQQAEEFLRFYKEDLSKEQLNLIGKFVDAKYHFLKRLSLVFSKQIYRQGLIDDFFFRIIILINKY